MSHGPGAGEAARTARRRDAWLTLVAVLALIGPPAGASAAPCQTVHGRLSLYNGAPTVRIRPAGGRRILGVVQPNEAFSDLPANVRRIWNARGDVAMWKSDLVGDFRVCASGPRRPGRMQIVSLVRADNLRLRPRGD